MFNLANFLQQTVRRSPDAIAIICGLRSLTFRELDERSDALAAALQGKGISVGDRVLMCLENGTEFVEVFAAVAKIGAVVVPVSPRLMPDEVRPIVENASPRIAIVKDCELFDYKAYVGECIALNEADERGVSKYEQVVSLARSQKPTHMHHDVFAICYTSGTSGRSKGALITHNNLVCSHGLIGGQLWRMSGADTFLVSMSLSSRASMGRLIFLFCFGGCLVLLEKFDPAEVVEAISKHKVTVASMVPTVAKMVLTKLEENEESCRSLRRLLIMGAAFPEDIRRKLCRLIPELEIHSMFASTEAGVITSLPPHFQFEKAGSVGIPVPGIEIRIADDVGAPLKDGESGEILLRSGRPGEMLVLQGYHENETQTAEAFVDGWFRTGDMGYFDKDGFLFLVDRKKDMIKTGGYNVYASEVEQCLRTHPAVDEVAVIGVPDPVYDEAIAAFIQLKPGLTNPSERDFIEHCRGKVAGYKKPRVVEFVSSMPRNEMGKILKRELKSRYETVASSRAAWPNV